MRSDLEKEISAQILNLICYWTSTYQLLVAVETLNGLLYVSSSFWLVEPNILIHLLNAKQYLRDNFLETEDRKNKKGKKGILERMEG